MPSTMTSLLTLLLPLSVSSLNIAKPREAAPVAAPEVTPSPGLALAERATGPFTVAFRNAAKIPVSILYQSNKGAPAPIGPTATTGVLGPAATTTVVFPTGWAGALVVGTSYNSQGSRFEASFVGSPAVNSYDISYVNGFSAPMVCGCNGQVVTGCNKPLFQMNSCPNRSSDGTVCLNPALNSPNGPPTAFFAPCRGAAYTYPNDNGAVSSCSSNSITCCIGPACPASQKQPA